MKILVIHNTYKFFGGEERVSLNEQELLREKGEQVILFSKNNASIDQYGLKDKIAFFPNTLNHRKHLRELRELVLFEKPDVAHIHNIYPLISPEVYKVLHKLNIPVVQSFHDHRLAMLCPQGNAFREGKACDLCHGGNYLPCVQHKCVKSSMPLSLVYTLALAKANLLGALTDNITLGIYFNDYMKNKLLKLGFPEKKLIQKPHFIKDDIGLPTYTQANYAVFIGAMSPQKGIFTLLEAYKKWNSPFKLKLIGEGDATEEINAFIQKHDLKNVEMLGFMGGNERFEILKNAMFSIVPSEVWETFCMSALESLACGVPVIGTRMGSIPFLVKDAETGMLFNAGNAEELKEKLAWMYTHPEQALEMGKRGRQIFEEKYTANNNYLRMMEIYNEAITLNKMRAP